MGGHRGPADDQARSNMKSMKGQLGTRSSALAPTSSKLTTQYLVLDHMNNHYKKIVNAKPAIDNGVPRSVSSSQKARDKRTQDYVKKTGRRPNSQMSMRPHSQMMMYTDDDDDYDEELLDNYELNDDDDRMVLDIMRTTMKANKSAGKMGSVDATYGGSEAVSTDNRNNRDRQGTHKYDMYANTSYSDTRRPGSARSVRSMRSTSSISRSQLQQKPHVGTYDGDVLEKRSHVFTEPAKPFTPRLLKSNRTSKLSQSKCYTAPPQKRKQQMTGRTEEPPSTPSQNTPVPKPRPRPRTSDSNPKQEADLSETTLMFETLHTRDFDKYDKEQVVPPLDISMDKDHMNWIKEQATKAEIRAKSKTLQSSMTKIQEDTLTGNSTTDFGNATNMTATSGTLGKTTRSFGSLKGSQKLSSQEEELKYVEFTKEVTEDVLNRGVFTNRVLQQVFDHHIAKRRGELDERKMRAVLNQVRNDLGVQDDFRSRLGIDKKSPTPDSLSSQSSKFGLTPEYNPQDTSQFDASKPYNQTFSSTIDSQNTLGMATSDGDMFSTIHSEKNEMTDTLALQSYQLDITRKEAIDEEQEEGEISLEDGEVAEIGEVTDAKSVESVQKKNRIVHKAEVHRDGDSQSVHSSASRSTAQGYRSGSGSNQPRQIIVKSNSHGPSSINSKSDQELSLDYETDDTCTITSQKNASRALSEVGTEKGAEGGDELESDDDMLVTATHRTSDDDF